jgi:hypothetical protein
MGCLSIFDITGIQHYLFRSSKLKENLGASILVTRALNALLTKAIKDVCPTDHVIDWENAGGFTFAGANPVYAEIVYIGGGNAMVAFKSRCIAIDTTKRFSILVQENIPGLEFCAAHLDTDFSDFSSDRKKLFNQELLKVKNSTLRSPGLLGMSITRQCPQTGLPAVAKDADRWISAETMAKRRATEADVFLDLIEDPNQFSFPLELDQLGQIRGENHIAVVFIDGNNMGRLLNERISEQTNYPDAIKTMREFSAGVSKIYRETFRDIVSKLVLNTTKDRDTYYCCRKLQLIASESRQAYLPVRPLLFDGDDLTFVSDGRLGISIAEHFLKAISHKKLRVAGKDYPLSACAGVAIVKSHFPFYRAHRLAEELCQSAKKKAKVLSTGGDIGSWVDFQIVHSGITSELSFLRDQQYNITGRDRSTTLQNHGIEYRQSHLCFRPWRVAPLDHNYYYDWDSFKEVYKDLCEEWPRSKLKNLREVFLQGQVELNLFLKGVRSRGKELPEFNACNGNNPFNQYNVTPYFDALELLDFFLEI